METLDMLQELNFWMDSYAGELRLIEGRLAARERWRKLGLTGVVDASLEARRDYIRSRLFRARHRVNQILDSYGRVTPAELQASPTTGNAQLDSLLKRETELEVAADSITADAAISTELAKIRQELGALLVSAGLGE